MGLFTRCCGKFKNKGRDPPNETSHANRRINYVAGDDSSNGNFDESTGQAVLTIGGIGEKPSVLKGHINYNKSTAKIHFG